MSRRFHAGMRLFACFAFALLVAAPAAHAGFTDALKKKVTDKATKKAEDAVDKTTDKAEKPAAEGEAAGKGEAAGSGGAGGKVSSVSTKFDFVPGDSVMFMDDFKQDELGEFPSRWRLTQGTFEVAEMEGERWFRCTSADGRVRMKLPAMDALPEFWTFEFDFYATEPMGSALTVEAMSEDGKVAWGAMFPHGSNMYFHTGAVSSSTPFEGGAVPVAIT